jgi:ribonuclease D
MAFLETRPTNMTVKLYRGDLPADFNAGASVAIDTETLGLNPRRDRLCVVQLSTGDGNAHIVQIDPQSFAAPRLKALLEDPAVLKIFHFARFDVAVLKHYLGARTSPIYCTKIASKIARTYTDRHGLKDILKELLDIEANKQQQSSDWGRHVLSDAQKSYAAQDVLYLHEMKARLDQMLEREGRMALAKACFEFLPARADLDLGGWGEEDVFAH